MIADYTKSLLIYLLTLTYIGSESDELIIHRKIISTNAKIVPSLIEEIPHCWYKMNPKCLCTFNWQLMSLTSFALNFQNFKLFSQVGITVRLRVLFKFWILSGEQLYFNTKIFANGKLVRPGSRFNLSSAALFESAPPTPTSARQSKVTATQNCNFALHAFITKVVNNYLYDVFDDAEL